MSSSSDHDDGFEPLPSLTTTASKEQGTSSSASSSRKRRSKKYDRSHLAHVTRNKDSLGVPETRFVFRLDEEERPTRAKTSNRNANSSVFSLSRIEESTIGAGDAETAAIRARSAPMADKKSKTQTGTAGAKWFNMPAIEQSEELERELEVLGMRHVLDPKRHYKKAAQRGVGGGGKFMQIGTVVEPATHSLSHGSTMDAKSKNIGFVESVLRDEEARRAVKRKFVSLQRSRAAGPKKRARHRR